MLGLCAFPEKEEKESRNTLFLMAIWIIITDKIFESKKNSDKTIKLFTIGINSILSGKNKNCAENEVLAESCGLFKEINKIAENKKASPSIVRLWKKSVMGFLAAMNMERRHSAEKMPSLDDYLKNGMKSIGSDPTFYILLMVYLRGRPSLSLEEFGIIKKIINKASLILRLANDIGSYRREQQDGKISSLIILSKRLGSSQKARVSLLKKIEARRQEIKKLHQLTANESHYFSGALCRIIDFNVGLYKIGDYYEK